jgi:hypothetical protein
MAGRLENKKEMPDLSFKKRSMNKLLNTLSFTTSIKNKFNKTCLTNYETNIDFFLKDIYSFNNSLG